MAILEFALILPALLVLTFGGYAVSEFVMIGRKTSLSCRTAVNLASTFTTLSAADITTILNAATLIIAPFGSAPLSIRLSGIATDSTGSIAHVVWSKGLHTTAKVANQLIALPIDLQTPNTFYVFGEVSYAYMPPINYGLQGPFFASTNLYMTPREPGSIIYNGP